MAALFDAAARFTERLPPGSPRLFLDSLTGQEIAGDTLAERAQPGEAVAVLTAHRSKGLEWDLVVVAGVQEGTWPDVRLRGSLLGMDELVTELDGGGLDRGGLDAGPAGRAASDAAAAALSSKLLDEERRLFYVAATRARRSLVVTAVGGEDSEDRPSRFLAELAGDDIEIEHVAGAGRGWLSLPALTADLRRTVADRAVPAALRRAAAAQLARLAAAGVPRGQPAALVRADRAVRARPADARPGPAVPVPGGELHQVRSALADRVGRRGQPRRACSGTSARSSTRRRCWPRTAGRRGDHQADRRHLAPPGLRQRLVQLQAAGAGREDGPQVPGLAQGQPARAGRAWSRRCASRSAGWRSPAGWTGWNGTRRAGRSSST